MKNILKSNIENDSHTCMSYAEARRLAHEITDGQTFYNGKQGSVAIIATLLSEVELLEGIINRVKQIHPPAYVHVCPDWDFMEINCYDPEFQSCTCYTFTKAQKNDSTTTDNS